MKKLLILPFLSAALWAQECPPARTLDAAYSAFGDFGDGLAAVQQDGKWGFINREGALVIPAQFQETNGFAEGKAAVRLDGYWGVIDTTGKLTVQPRYQDAHRYFNGILPVSKNGSDFIGLDHHGREVALPVYAVRPPAETFYDQATLKRGLKDMQGNIIIAPGRYDVIEPPWQTDMISVRKNDVWGFTDMQGEERIAPRYQPPAGKWSPAFGDGLALVMENGRHVYIDKNGCAILQQAAP